MGTREGHVRTDRGVCEQGRVRGVCGGLGGQGGKGMPAGIRGGDSVSSNTGVRSKVGGGTGNLRGATCWECERRKQGGWVHRGGCRLGPNPKGGGWGTPPPLYRPLWLYWSMEFVGAGGAGDFVLGTWQGEIFLFYPMCLYSKNSECCGEIKNGWKTHKKKRFDPDPTSGLDLG